MSILEEFASRWRNWIRWCNQKGLYQARVGSAEGAYRSPQHWDPPEPRPSPVDRLDALKVNRAYIRLWHLAPTYALVIQVLIFKHPNMRPQGQAQKLGTHYLRLDLLLHKAKMMLANQLSGTETRSD